MKKLFLIHWLIWTLSSAILALAVSVSKSDNNLISTMALVLSLSPLLGLLLTLGSLKAALQFNNWLLDNKYSIYSIAGGISLLFAIPGLMTGNFNPYYTVIFASVVFAVFGTMRGLRSEEFKMGWTDLAIWIILWIPFDLRWCMELLPAVDSISYAWWSIAVSVIGIIGWYGYRGADIGFNLVPKLKDLYIALLALVMIMVLVIPPGLATGFLSFSVPGSFDIPKLTLHFIGLFLTVALPEELFFRGILLRGLDKVFSNKWMPMVISSLAFGLMHWNNVDTLSAQISYVSLATLAGLGYGWAYKKSGNNLFAAMLTHTLVDWVWKLLLAA